MYSPTGALGFVSFYCTFSKRFCLLDCNSSGHREQIPGLISSALKICKLMGVTMTDPAMSRKQWPLQIQEGRDLLQSLRGLHSHFKGGESGGCTWRRLFSGNVRKVTTRGLGYLGLLEFAGKHWSHLSADVHTPARSCCWRNMVAAFSISSLEMVDNSLTPMESCWTPLLGKRGKCSLQTFCSCRTSERQGRDRVPHSTSSSHNPTLYPRALPLCVQEWELGGCFFQPWVGTCVFLWSL